MGECPSVSLGPAGPRAWGGAAQSPLHGSQETAESGGVPAGM